MPLRRRHLFCASLLLVPSAFAQGDAVTLEGQRFERRLQVAGQDLLLNGTGVRQVAWFKGYAAGLYLARRCNTADRAVALPGAKRLQLRMLQDVAAAEFVKAFRKGIQRNVAAEALPAMADAMRRFEALVSAIGQVNKGDRVDLDFEPGRGTSLSLNGTLRGEAVAGDALFAALLRSFVGDRPYDERLKAGLLGERA
ncbi:MAG TPA: chalcone isomerase family protein [Alicycliphilus sp.]|nr:chalcone isomerase family protein [Alicycliphilus sp.]